MKVIGLEDIKLARQQIQSEIYCTDLRESEACSHRIGTSAYLKFENMQRTGSFKIRGALNKISSLSAEERAQGVIASSAGNHAQGVAFAAQMTGTKAHIVMPETASLVKAEGARSLGAEVILHGSYYDEAYAFARTLSESQGYVFVHPYEDPYVIAGQGTIGLELLEQLPDLESVLVPIGGGGLISGIAVAIKSLRPSCRVYGIQAEATPSMAQSFLAKKLASPYRQGATIADGIAVKNPSAYIYENYISRLVDDVCTVSDEEIAEAIVLLLDRTKTVVEGAGAVGLAAAMKGKFELGQRTCVVISGGNIDLNMIAKIIESGLVRHGRLAKMTVIVDDIPGKLSLMTQAIATLRGNILEVHHDRVSKGLYLKETKVDFLVETVDEDHAQKIRQALVGVGARLAESH